MPLSIDVNQGPKGLDLANTKFILSNRIFNFRDLQDIEAQVIHSVSIENRKCKIIINFRFKTLNEYAYITNHNNIKVLLILILKIEVYSLY